MRCLFNIFISAVCLLACNSKQTTQNETINASNASITATDTAIIQPVKDSFETGKIMPHISCKADAAQSYALYIPVAPKDTPMPVIYFFDPHADGALPLRNYQALADAYHFILIGSNNSKNGNNWNNAQNIWNTLYTDTKNRLPFNSNRIYMCGFSGGAKVAAFLALHQQNIQGAIAAGAGLPEDQPIGNFSFSFTGMAGRGDMNMTDLVALNSALDKTTTRHRLILFDGKHAWPPLNIMRTAFEGLQLDAMHSQLINKNDSFIQSFTTEMQQQINEDIAAKRWLEAEQACALAANMLNGLINTDAFAKKADIIINNPEYQHQLQTSQQLFAIEQQKKQTFQQQFQQGDIQYWNTTINDLHAKAKASTAEGAMYQRLLAYLSLAFFSISNNLINNNQNDVAEYYVTLYKMADPTNSEAWYFSALLDARNNNPKAAEADLLKATDCGFTDTQRMLQQPEFQNLSSQINFQLIESRMGKE